MVFQSVEILGNQNKITREKIGRLQAQIGDRKTSRSENFWEYQRKCPETWRALKVYQGTGVQVATDLRVVAACEILTDAVNVSSSGHPEQMHTPIAYGAMDGEYMDYAYEEDEARSSGQTISMSASQTTSRKSPAKYATPTKPTVELRTFFPENWLFDLQVSDGMIDR